MIALFCSSVEDPARPPFLPICLLLLLPFPSIFFCRLFPVNKPGSGKLQGKSSPTESGGNQLRRSAPLKKVSGANASRCQGDKRSRQSWTSVAPHFYFLDFRVKPILVCRPHREKPFSAGIITVITIVSNNKNSEHLYDESASVWGHDFYRRHFHLLVKSTSNSERSLKYFISPIQRQSRKRKCLRVAKIAVAA